MNLIESIITGCLLLFSALYVIYYYMNAFFRDGKNKSCENCPYSSSCGKK